MFSTLGIPENKPVSLVFPLFRYYYSQQPFGPDEFSNQGTLKMTTVVPGKRGGAYQMYVHARVVDY
jgi:hypothetical protein